MILEVAMLDVRPGAESEFEAAFRDATTIIASSPGFVSLELQHCVERPERYVLLVRWERLEDHTVGFRGSEDYQQWKELLHHFYEPFPIVQHFEAVVAL